MGAKKGKKKGGKGKKKSGVSDDADPVEKNYIMQAEVESLKQRLHSTVEHANICKASEHEKRYREKQQQ